MSSIQAIRRDTLQLMRTLGEEHLGQALQELGWTFEWDQAKRRMGACITARRGQQVRIISLSKIHAKHSGWDVMEDVARHEIAHALDYETRGTTAHGSVWKRWAERCGADASRLYEGGDLTPIPAKYKAVCPASCGYEIGFHRMVKRWYVCPDCTDAASNGQQAYLHIIERASGRVRRRGGMASAPGQLINGASGWRETAPAHRAACGDNVGPGAEIANRNLNDPKDEGYKYTAACPKCGHMVGYRRKLKRRRACLPCCTEYSNGQFDARFEMEIRQNY